MLWIHLWWVSDYSLIPIAYFGFVLMDLWPWLYFLQEEYTSNPGFYRKMKWLKEQGWHGVRRTKGDGDCFYRCKCYSLRWSRTGCSRHSPLCILYHHSDIDNSAFAFAWVERILRAKNRELAVAAAISVLHTTFLGLSDVGFDVSLVSSWPFSPHHSIPYLSYF
jgi:ubiquitin thioesterase protein OTUB1